MAAVVASEVASVLGTLLPMSPPMAPPSGYHTPPVPPVAMLKESLFCACTGGAARKQQGEQGCGTDDGPESFASHDNPPLLSG